MKKLLFVLLSGLLLCSCCSEIRLTKGSYKPMKGLDGTVEFVLDLDKTQAVEYNIFRNPFTNDSFTINHVIGTIDERNAKAGEDYVRDWPAVREQMEQTFVYRFNRKYGKRGAQLCLGKGSTPYRVVFHVAHLDFGSTGANVAGGVVNAVFGSGSFYGGGYGGCILDGTVELQDTRTGEVLGVITIQPVKTDGSPSETVRLCELINYCGKWSAKRAKR